MNRWQRLISWPRRMFLDYGSRTAIFLVRRRVKKRPRDIGSWIVLARLFEVRNDPSQAVKLLLQAKKLAPHNRTIQFHLERLQAKVTKAP